jgi:hypothetical protein
MDALLQLIGKTSDRQIATEAHRRSGAMCLAPGKPQLLRRPIEQSGNLRLHVGHIRTARSAVSVAASTEQGDGSPEFWRAEVS